MQERVIIDRVGRPHTVLAWSCGLRDALAFDALNDEQLQRWHRHFAGSGVLPHETRLLRGECLRRGLNPDARSSPGQLDLFGPQECHP